MWTDTKVPSLLNISQGYKGDKTRENAFAASCPQCSGTVDKSSDADIKGQAKKQNKAQFLVYTQTVKWCFLEIITLEGVFQKFSNLHRTCYLCIKNKMNTRACGQVRHFSKLSPFLEFVHLRVFSALQLFVGCR